MIGPIFAGLMFSSQPAGQFEQDLGFDLPEPFVFESNMSADMPVSVLCNEPEGSGCPHFDRSHWDYIGYVAARRDSDQWGNVLPMGELLVSNGWIAVRPETGDRVTGFRKTYALQPGICAKYLSIDYSYRDALGVTLHIVPCIDEADK